MEMDKTQSEEDCVVLVTTNVYNIFIKYFYIIISLWINIT